MHYIIINNLIGSGILFKVTHSNFPIQKKLDTTMFLHKFAGLLNLKIKLTALVCKQVGLMNFYMGKNTAIFFPIFLF